MAQDVELVKLKLRECLGALAELERQTNAAEEEAEEDSDEASDAENDGNNVREAVTAIEDAINSLDSIVGSYSIGEEDFVAEQ